MTLAVLAAGVWSVTASQAGAGTATIVRQFTCALPIIGTQSVTISVVPPALDTATVGVPTPRLVIPATGTVAPAARLVVSFLGAEWAEGTGVMAGEVDTPQGTIKQSMPFTVPRTDVATGSGPLSFPGSGTLPSLTFSRPGVGEVLVTGLTFHLSLLTSGGGQALMSPFNITCTLASGQSGAVASFRILPAVPGPSPSPARGTATSSPSLRPASPTPSSAPGLVTSSPAPQPSPAPIPPAKPSFLASYLQSFLARDLLWSMGIVGVGTLGGVAWSLLRRWLARRPAR
jgi:hypothetical protein